MSKTEAASEPSMDEILASIRRIIQEDPDGTRANRPMTPPLPLAKEAMLPVSALWAKVAPSGAIERDDNANIDLPAPAAAASPMTDWASALAKGIAAGAVSPVAVIEADDDLAELTGEPVVTPTDLNFGSLTPVMPELAPTIRAWPSLT